MAGGPEGFEEAFGAKLRGAGDFGRRKRSAFDDRRSQRDESFFRPRDEKTDGPGAIDRMRAEKCEGIGMASGDKRVDLRLDSRVARSNVLRMRGCRVRLGQV